MAVLSPALPAPATAERCVFPNDPAVLQTHPLEEGKTSADWFMRNFCNLTIDVGNNPRVGGVRWYGNNTSILKNIRVLGRGKNGRVPDSLSGGPDERLS